MLELKLLFRFQKCSSIKKQNIHQNEAVDNEINAFTHSSEFYESPPEGAVPGIRLRNLKKVYIGSIS